MDSSHSIPDSLRETLSRSLLGLRIGVFLVMLMWTLDKFVNPSHAGKVFDTFYGIGGLTQYLAYVIGVAELLLMFAFVAGMWRRWTYGAVLILHAVSTPSAYKLYLAPFDNLLFFAAWSLLAACCTLYWLRDWDTLCTIPAGVIADNMPEETLSRQTKT